MGKLPASPLEVRAAAVLFLLLLGPANFFGAWQVKNFASFTPAGVAATVAPGGPGESDTSAASTSSATEQPISLAALDQPRHHIEQKLLVEDSHVHIPVYAMIAALLSLVIFGLRLSSRVRVLLVAAAFAAPFLDFAGLWGAHLFPNAGVAFGTVAVVGGFAMGAVYTVVLFVTLYQCGLRPVKE
ncbi:MAG TPA: hypothetical protein VKA53_11430 [Thermoanaerobaculia bacterium]|nr:hypothetical protein [Thermoanaerobaculia bacterium]